MRERVAGLFLLYGLGASESVNKATDVIFSYINFCEDMLIPTKMVKIFPNNKPWITKALKKTIDEKKKNFSV